MQISCGYNLIFNSFVKSDMVAKMAPLSQASSSAATDKIYLILLRRSKAVHLRQNRFEILQHIKNSRDRGVPSTTPTSLECTTVRV